MIGQSTPNSSIIQKDARSLNMKPRHIGEIFESEMASGRQGGSISKGKERALKNEMGI